MSKTRLTRLLHAWSLPVLLVLSVLLPSLILAWTATTERARVLAEAEASGVRTVTALHEHAAKVFDIHEFVLSEVMRRVDGRAWPDISSDAALWAELSGMIRSLDSLASIVLADADGRVRLTTAAFPAPIDASIAGQDHFLAHLPGQAARTHVAPCADGTDGPHVALSRRLSDPEGGFAGVAKVSVPVAEFTGFWERFAPTIAHIVPLVRSDGLVIARYPAEAVPARLSTRGPFLSRALAMRDGTYTAVSQVDGIERLNAFTRIKDYPLHIAFSVETRAMLSGWRTRMELLTFYTVLATIALLGMSLMAARQYQDQRRAARTWREQADRLESEMAAREQAEAQLRRAQTLDAVGQLTAGVAHDFNNLLQAVKSGLFLLRKRSTDKASHEIMDGALSAVDRGAKLVRQMMVFARRERLEPRPVDLRAQVAGMGELLGKALGTGIRVEAEFEEGLPAVMADPTQTELAVLNLAINARDAMPRAQGVLTIAAREVAREEADPDTGLQAGRYVALSVADDGDGMPPEVAARVLEPFFTTKAPGHGTGLGLSMVHGFVTGSGGGMRVESTPGRGTIVTLYLPLAGAEAEMPAPALPAQAAAGPAATVLLVDDDALGRMATAAALREMGHQVVEARAGDEALPLLRRADLDLLVTDYAMPGMNGAELAEAARRLRPELPVVMITGFAAAAPEELSRGAVAVLHKPFRVEDLDRRIRRVMAVRHRTAEIARA